jgi:alpha-N-acetylglucosamine transferase
MLNIVCFKWGNWPVNYVYKLKNMVERHVTLPHTFSCFSDKEIKGIDTIEIPPHVLTWKKNFPKFYVYSKNNGLSGRTIMLDLDIVIVDNIDEMLSYSGAWCAVRPLGKPNARHRGGALVSFDQDKYHWLYDDMAKNVGEYERLYRGNERFVYEKYFYASDTWQDLFPGYVQSYKWGVKKKISDNLKYIIFHGNPRPHQVNDELITEHWK